MYPQLKKTLQTATTWISRHAKWILLILTGSLIAATVLRKRSNAVETVGDALEVQKARLDVIKKREQIKKLDTRDRKKVEEIIALDAKITAQKKVIAEAMSGREWEKLSDDEVRAALKELGL